MDGATKRWHADEAVDEASHDARIRVLVCEDQRGDFKIIEQRLRAMPGWSVEVEWTPDIDQAHRAIAAMRHDVALLDYRLVGGSGLDLLRDAIAMDWPGPIIMITGIDDPEVDHTAMKLGAADFIRKEDLTSDGLERCIRYSRERARLQTIASETNREMLRYIRDLRDAYGRIDQQNQRIVSLAYHLAAHGEGSTAVGSQPSDGDGATLGSWTFESDGQTRHADSVVFGLLELDGLGSLRDRRLDALMAPESCEQLSHMLQTTAVGEATTIEVELIGQSSGKRSWAVLSLLRNVSPDGEETYVANVVDITTRRNTENANRYLAQHDSLTGLANRRLLAERFAHATAISQRNDTMVGLICLDLNDFKQVNDTAGHPAGDELLKQVGRRLTLLARQSDTVARLGGDEFAVLATNLHSIGDLELIGRKIEAVLERPFDLRGRTVHCGASVGWGLCPDEGDNLEDLFDVADNRLYRSKSLSKTRTQQSG